MYETLIGAYVIMYIHTNYKVNIAVVFFLIIMPSRSCHCY